MKMAPMAQQDGLFAKVLSFLLRCGCDCSELCDSDCLRPRRKGYIRKEDIVYEVPSQTSWTSIDQRTSVDSFSSDSESRRSISTAGADVAGPAPIEFWTASVGREHASPRLHAPRRRSSLSKLSHIQPDLYESFDESTDLTDDEKSALYKLGQVHFSLQYDVASQALLVKVIAGRDLCRPPDDRPERGRREPNPYVKACLLPDQKTCQQTSVKRKTAAPNWDEVLPFALAHSEAQRRILELSVMDHAPRQHVVLGQVHLPLSGVNIVRGRHMWKPLMPSTKENPELGEILLSIYYLPSAGRLNVDVIKAKQLLQTNITGGSRISIFETKSEVDTELFP
ncbi:PREDICTED: synaptotagmin-17-like [Priapulus caudatus]|uniref:Synaptotagmin-17-like n=1 Tax=Priapulus caudatus TaxID=37621 RepID=A0ABM1F9S9_PRICU|nr:PREDICTED: synaptotagmin-17-like [Priapulus caudatus]